MSRRRKNSAIGGVASKVGPFVWVLILLGALLSIIGLRGYDDIGTIIDDSREAAAYFFECVPQFNCDFSKDIASPGPKEEVDLSELGNYKLDPELINYKGPDAGEAYILDSAMITKEGALGMLSAIEIAEPQDVEYSRRDYKHWNTYPSRSCWTVRKEVLANQSVSENLTFLDKNKNQVTSKDEACVIDSGEWIDPYSGTRIEDSSSVDIDHVIPLSYAAKHGADSWETEKKQEFANDIRFLLATSAKENRSKGDKGPSEYMPADRSYHCVYAKTWTTAAYTYELSLSQKDYNKIEDTLYGCSH